MQIEDQGGEVKSSKHDAEESMLWLLYQQIRKAKNDLVGNNKQLKEIISVLTGEFTSYDNQPVSEE